MNLRALNRGEVVATLGGILLGVSLFLAWYTLNSHNAFAHIHSCGPPPKATSCTGWESLSFVRYLLLLAALAPAILAWVIVRGHALAWPRGELTAVVAVIALVLTLFMGVIDHPGSPHDEISVDYGWWLALVGGMLILSGSVWRSRESAPRRNPPGVL